MQPIGNGTNLFIQQQALELMTVADDYQHRLLRKTLKASFRDYGRGIAGCTSEWAIGIANRAIKSGMPLDEVMGILMMAKTEVPDDMRRQQRLDDLGKHLTS